MATAISNAQLAANRANGQQSTGPKTDDGKATSSQNALRHGLNACRFILLENESQEDFDKLREALWEEHEPSTATEEILVDNMAKHHWLMNRALRYQRSCLKQGPKEYWDKRLALMIRYQTTHERAFKSNLNQLLKLRKERQTHQNGFVSHQAKIMGEIRRAQADNLKLELLQAKVAKLPKSANPENPVPAASQTANQPDGNIPKEAPAAA